MRTRTIVATNGEQLLLTASRLQEVKGYGYWVRLSDLKLLRTICAWELGIHGGGKVRGHFALLQRTCDPYSHNAGLVAVQAKRIPGGGTVGCKTFDRETFNLIVKAIRSAR